MLQLIAFDSDMAWCCHIKHYSMCFSCFQAAADSHSLRCAMRSNLQMLETHSSLWFRDSKHRSCRLCYTCAWCTVKMRWCSLHQTHLMDCYTYSQGQGFICNKKKKLIDRCNRKVTAYLKRLCGWLDDSFVCHISQSDIFGDSFSASYW